MGRVEKTILIWWRSCVCSGQDKLVGQFEMNYMVELSRCLWSPTTLLIESRCRVNRVEINFLAKPMSEEKIKMRKEL